MAVGYKKINHENVSNDSFKMKDYFKTLNIRQARLQFKINSKMTPKVAANFHRNPQYREIDYMCVGCSVGRGSDGGTEGQTRNLDSEDHILRCNSYADLRLNLDLNVQCDMLKYFQLVIDRRIEEEQIR